MKTEEKLAVISLFVEAGIAYYLQSDWKAVLTRNKQYKYWKNKTAQDFEHVLNSLFVV